LIANVKKVFLKAPSRVEVFKSLEPDLNLPPEPVITRWGTWLEALKYYAVNYEKIVRVFDSLNVEEAVSIKNAQNLLNDKSIRSQLIFIESNYGFLAESIKKLESSGLSLASQIEIVSDAIDAVNNVKGDTANSIKTKLDSVVNKNVGFEMMKNISMSLSEHSSINHTIYTVKELLAFKYAPITSVNVERSFSMFKSVFRSNRQSFLFENISEMLIIYCNKAFN
jgi:hypothetical protein